MKINSSHINKLARGALIAALYAALTILLAPISYGPVQCRVSEAFTLLPFYLPEAVPGLFIGCIFANFIGGYGLPDMVFGSLATLVAAFLTLKSGNIFVAALWPVLSNMIIIGTMLHYLIEAPLVMTCIYVALGELISCYVIGVPFMKLLERKNIIAKHD
ncbi:MAG: QueT transporter family protein [Synergistaceae bacterium]|nr:QueT transporter family protein [Synergistaceae bacterium]MBQ9595612.1 QueT transporter family protein [Synergistaceae bacterium]